MSRCAIVLRVAEVVDAQRSRCRRRAACWARKKLRPIRPKPLMPTRIAMCSSLSSSCLRVESSPASETPPAQPSALPSRERLRNWPPPLILVQVGSRSRAVNPDPVRRLVSERAVGEEVVLGAPPPARRTAAGESSGSVATGRRALQPVVRPSDSRLSLASAAATARQRHALREPALHAGLRRRRARARASSRSDSDGWRSRSCAASRSGSGSDSAPATRGGGARASSWRCAAWLVRTRFAWSALASRFASARISATTLRSSSASTASTTPAASR